MIYRIRENSSHHFPVFRSWILTSYLHSAQINPMAIGLFRSDDLHCIVPCNGGKKWKRDHGDHGRHEELVPKLHQDSQHISRLAVTTLLQPALLRSPLIIPNLSTHSLLGGRITFRGTVFSRTAITTPSQSWANSAFHAALVELLTFDRELDPGAQVIQNLLALQYSTGRLTIMKTT